MAIFAHAFGKPKEPEPEEPRYSDSVDLEKLTSAELEQLHQSLLKQQAEEQPLRVVQDAEQ